MPSVAKLLLFIVAASGGFFASDIVNWINAKDEPISLEEYCLLSTSPCIQGQTQLQASKDTSQPLVPTTVSVDWPAESDELLVSLQGLEMDMGTVVFKLEKNESGQFRGDIILPVCTTEAMTWYGTISDGNTSVKTSVRMER